jgi:enamine deaminase RidA (YjgF/YER057c/UK114 family)
MRAQGQDEGVVAARACEGARRGTHLRYFGHATPTSTTVQISRFADPDAMIEIEAIAVIDD